MELISEKDHVEFSNDWDVLWVTNTGNKTGVKFSGWHQGSKVVHRFWGEKEVNNYAEKHKLRIAYSPDFDQWFGSGFDTKELGARFAKESRKKQSLRSQYYLRMIIEQSKESGVEVEVTD